jgi:hypothetical protein
MPVEKPENSQQKRLSGNGLIQNNQSLTPHSVMTAPIDRAVFEKGASYTTDEWMVEIIKSNQLVTLAQSSTGKNMGFWEFFGHLPQDQKNQISAPHNRNTFIGLLNMQCRGM